MREMRFRTKKERQTEVYKDLQEAVRLARDFAVEDNWLQLRKAHETLMNLVIDAIRYEAEAST